MISEVGYWRNRPVMLCLQNSARILTALINISVLNYHRGKTTTVEFLAKHFIMQAGSDLPIGYVCMGTHFFRTFEAIRSSGQMPSCLGSREKEQTTTGPWLKHRKGPFLFT